LSGLRLGFAGTPEFAATILAALLASGRTPVVVYTQPDRPTGRGRRTRPGAVARLAAAHGLDVRQPATLREPDSAAILAGFGLDVLVVAAYGLILPQAILDVPRYGCVNVHASLLPRWRGAAPIERAIMAGDTATGVSIMRMERGLETGPVYLAREWPIGPATTGTELEADLANLGAELLIECLNRLPHIEAVPQPSAGASYAPKLTTADAAIDWTASATVIGRQVRALCGRRPAFTFAGDTRVQVLAASPDEDSASAGVAPGTVIAAAARSGITVACGTGALRITRLQLNRGKGLPMHAADALNGFPDLLGVGRFFHVGHADH
jgi:methionyl-tRNA formyltransferase